MNNLIEKNVSDMQEMMRKLMEISITNTNEMRTEIRTMGNKLDVVEKRMDDFENNSELTTQQRNGVRRAVNKHIYELLGLPLRKQDWSLDDRIIAKKYSQLFHQRCYSEVAKKGHLSSPYGTTTAQNYIDAIKDIEAWTPSNGIDGLKKEADDNALANKIAKEEGYHN